jgi:hypothetical protein
MGILKRWPPLYDVIHRGGEDKRKNKTPTASVRAVSFA